MMRLILFIAASGLFVSGLVGCHASADVHPEHATSVQPVR
jgi:hypothetical protein